MSRFDRVFSLILVFLGVVLCVYSLWKGVYPLVWGVFLLISHDQLIADVKLDRLLVHLQDLSAQRGQASTVDKIGASR